MSHHLLLIIHLLSATIWVGGHLLLVFGFLPQALKEKNQNIILDYERKYEPVGMTALVLLVITGILMAYKYGVSIEYWFQFETPIEKVVSTKLALLLLTVLFALSAQFRVLPKLEKGAEKLPEMTFHILSVTIIGVLMVVFGSFVRYGGL
ncbi:MULTISPECIES: CopD family protein [Flavobacterium]|uniref:CopD family protein n=1 Tax=Flavobacterium quisquiliarum TaxID=1834436 RepID=A0ABV8W2B2_9FLAO|nr:MULTISPECIES: CopD family protein [Flavobacterium]MBW1656136.1 copper resistance protein CopD [Flavobacterium quisquiliarum]NWL03525.1 copper resistance protein CopD [Flavobacterium collinsii]WET02909.1 CopD family protein [Flavobacterium sp. YJ01]